MSRFFYMCLVLILAFSAFVNGNPQLEGDGDSMSPSNENNREWSQISSEESTDEAESEDDEESNYDYLYYSEALPLSLEESEEEDSSDIDTETSQQSSDYSQPEDADIVRSKTRKAAVKKRKPRPLKCGRLEVEACVYTCPPEKTCRNRHRHYRCKKNRRPCQRKCVCKRGYFRNAIGECITEAQCRKCSKSHEFFSCGGACDNDCKNIQYQSRTNCPIRNKRCNEKCYCEDGYARNKKGDCIPVSQCRPPPLKCGRNEEEVCSTGCPPEKTCENRDIEYACPAVVLPCKRTCQCKPGYYKNAIGQCITGDECAKCNKPNEFFSCGGACDNECKNIKTQSRTNCPIRNIVCNKKCYCKDGFARDDQGNCIPVEQCQPQPKPLNCKPHEVEACVHRCVETTCRNRKMIFMCKPDFLPCQRKCVCEGGYLRNAIGECITKAQCEQCSKPNEFFSCGSACDNECKYIQNQNRTNCPIINKKCNEKCYCDDGYARDDNGDCIPVSECKPACSDPNEEYVLGRSCPPDYCRSLVAKYKCDSTEVEQYRCRCKSGFFRLTAGSPCIPICQCPQMANSPDCLQKS